MQQRSLHQGVIKISPLLKNSIKGLHPGKPNPNWWISKNNFVPQSSSRTLESGAVTFSAGWFAQAHDASWSKLVIK